MNLPPPPTDILQLYLVALGYDIGQSPAHPDGVDGVFGPKTLAALRAAQGRAGVPVTGEPDPVTMTALTRLLAQHPVVRANMTLTEVDYADAARRLGVRVAIVKAVKEVESNGGWFMDVRKDILDLDGPGGFIDGPDLPKILFEAHKFAAHTGGRYNGTHPNISSPSWNQKLYKGGPAEYARLWQAMQLDRPAALKSASWGLFQILGENHKAAGFSTVEQFVEAMYRSETDHLMAFVTFVQKTSGLLSKLQAISADPETCRPFCRAYNGPAYATHDYHGRIARAVVKWDRMA